MTERKTNQNKNIPNVKTFIVPYKFEDFKDAISIHTNTNYQLSKERIINQALKFHAKEDIKEAIKYYQYFINQGFENHQVFSNYGVILEDLGNLKEAEILYRKAIKIKPDFAEAHSNLGNMLRGVGKLKEAELFTRKAIKLNPKFANAYSNLGNIMSDIGNLIEAESCHRKAIEFKPDCTETLSNLGNVLRDLGKLKESEIFSRKAIKLNPDFADAHTNLGNTLRCLENFKESERCHRKAIKLNPNSYHAYSNLGNTFSDMGNLKEAERYHRKAIELYPDCAEANSNLGSILRYLGKIKDSLTLSKSILESKSISQGYKLLASLQITIANLLQNNFPETLSSINYTNDLIKQGAINSIKNKKNKTHLLTYSRFISALYPLLQKESKKHNSKQIPHFGESHCLSFAHQSLTLSSEIKTIQPVLITGGKAWHYANKKNNKWKDSLTQQMKNHNYSDEVFISFGEIDCRKDEGILTYSIKNNKPLSEVCIKTIQSFLEYFEKVLSEQYKKRFYFGVAAPKRRKELLDELDVKRIKLIKEYNSIFKKEVLSRGCYFLDVYELTSNRDGENNNVYMCDSTHLSPMCLPVLFEKYLYKRY